MTKNIFPFIVLFSFLSCQNDSDTTIQEVDTYPAVLAVFGNTINLTNESYIKLKKVTVYILLLRYFVILQNKIN